MNFLQRLVLCLDDEKVHVEQPGDADPRIKDKNRASAEKLYEAFEGHRHGVRQYPVDRGDYGGALPFGPRRQQLPYHDPRQWPRREIEPDDVRARGQQRHEGVVSRVVRTHSVGIVKEAQRPQARRHHRQRYEPEHASTEAVHEGGGHPGRHHLRAAHDARADVRRDVPRRQGEDVRREEHDGVYAAQLLDDVHAQEQQEGPDRCPLLHALLERPLARLDVFLPFVYFRNDIVVLPPVELENFGGSVFFVLHQQDDGRFW